MIGIYCVNSMVHRDLGIHITSNHNCTWFVMYNEGVLGFCCAERRNKYIFLKHDYIVPIYRGLGLYDKLFKNRLEFFDGESFKATCNDASLNTYLRYGFKIKLEIGKFTKVEL